MISKIKNKLSILFQYKNLLSTSNHIVRDMARVFGMTRVPALPLTLDIEPNNHCNFSCDHCQVTHWSKPKTNLDVEGFTRILNQFPRLHKIKLQGMGEPLLNKALLPMLALAEQRGIKTTTFTNGSVMGSRVLNGLRDSKTDITFSIDGASAEVFERIRIGSSFKNVLANIASLSAQRTGHPKLLRAYTVVTKHNVMELPAIVRLVAGLKLDTLVFQLSLNSWGKEKMEALIAPQRAYELSVTDEQITLAKMEAERLGLPLTIAEDRFSRTKKCRWAWTSAYIASNGDVVPCCVLADSDTAKLGNLFEEDFSKIWNGARYRELRRQIRDHDLPEYCKNCYVDADPAQPPKPLGKYRIIKVEPLKAVG